jgi:hypothetical protein
LPRITSADGVSTTWGFEIYINDVDNNASVNNITITQNSVDKINGALSTPIVLNTNGATGCFQIVGSSSWEFSFGNSINSGILSIPINNTVFVAKNGNDSTGLVQRLDKPFLTFAAARAALNAAFPVGARTANTRYLTKAFSGYYTEGIVLDNFGDFDLSDCVLDLQSGSLATIDDNNVACTSIIYGNPVLKRTTAGTMGIVRTQNAGTLLTVFMDSFVCTQGDALLCTNGTQVIKIRNADSTFVSSGYVAQCDGGSQTIDSVNILGAVITPAILCNAGVQNIVGSVLGARCVGGAQTIKGNVDGGANCRGGTQVVYGNCTSSSGLVCADSQTTGNQTIYGNVIATFADINTRAARVRDTAVQNIYGDITSAGTVIAALTCESSGISVYNCESITGTHQGVDISAGTVRINNARIVATGADKSSVNKSGGTLMLKDCTLIATGTGNSILAGAAQNVLIYGACEANIAVNGNITLVVGTVANGRYLVSASVS